MKREHERGDFPAARPLQACADDERIRTPRGAAADGGGTP
jgi:hypothetical protein